MDVPARKLSTQDSFSPQLRSVKYQFPAHPSRIVGQRFYWGEQEIDISQISTAVKRNPEWKVFLRVHPQVTHSVVQDALKEIGNGGQADVIFATFKSGN